MPRDRNSSPIFEWRARSSGVVNWFKFGKEYLPARPITISLAVSVPFAGRNYRSIHLHPNVLFARSVSKTDGNQQGPDGGAARQLMHQLKADTHFARSQLRAYVITKELRIFDITGARQYPFALASSPAFQTTSQVLFLKFLSGLIIPVGALASTLLVSESPWS